MWHLVTTRKPGHGPLLLSPSCHSHWCIPLNLWMLLSARYQLFINFFVTYGNIQVWQRGKSDLVSFDKGRLIFIWDRMAHFYLFSSWKSKKWEVKPASPWQPLQRGFLSRWRGVIMELKFLPVLVATGLFVLFFSFVWFVGFFLGSVRCGLVRFSGAGG